MSVFDKGVKKCIEIFQSFNDQHFSNVKKIRIFMAFKKLITKRLSDDLRGDLALI